MSKKSGGDFTPDHSCHRNGTEVDIRYVRNDGKEDPLNIATDPDLFDEEKTKYLIGAFIYNGFVEAIYVDGENSELDEMGYDYITNEAYHSNHFHVRIVDPDGTTN